MKLNPNCIRDILISVEENTGYRIYFDYPSELDKAPLLAKYSDEEIRYHILQCEKSYLIEIPTKDINENYAITDLTPKGHEFLANIRSENVWKDVKEVSKKVGSNSLSALSQIATGVITEIIKTQLGLPLN